MKQVAAAAGVSVMTVSLSLKNHPRISENTKKRVIEIAEKLGYQPDPALSALIAYRSKITTPAYAGTIAFLNSYPDEQHYKKQRIYREYFESAKRQASRYGYNLEVYWLGNPKISESRLREILFSRNIRGLIFGPMPTSRQNLDPEWTKFQGVALGYSLKSPNFDRVGTSLYHSAKTCMEKLTEIGYKRIGFVDTPEQEDRTAGRWLGGVLSYQYRFLPPNRRVNPLVGAKNENLYLKWIKKEKPDVILAGQNDLIEFLPIWGLKVPQDIGFAFLFYHKDYPEFSFFREDVSRIANVAVDYLVQKLNSGGEKNQESALNLMVNGIWESGISTR